MPATRNKLLLAEEAIVNKIYMIRGQKIMLDRDLAVLYGVETKVLKQAVRRNLKRFPKDFMFTMTKKELENWRSQFVTSNSGELMGLRYAPYCFTEQGVTMLACILNSNRAIAVNIRIIRIFVKMREMITTNKDILLKLEQLERKVTGHDEDMQVIFSAIKQLLHPPTKPRTRIGFRRPGEKD
jgi:hypothetical protein